MIEPLGMQRGGIGSERKQRIDGNGRMNGMNNG